MGEEKREEKRECVYVCGVVDKYASGRDRCTVGNIKTEVGKEDGHTHLTAKVVRETSPSNNSTYAAHPLPNPEQTTVPRLLHLL